MYNNLKSFRKYILFLIDFVFWNLAYYLAFATNIYNFSIIDCKEHFIQGLIIVNLCFMIVFLSFKLYDKIWRYADVEDFFYIGLACICANLLFLIISIIIDNLGIRTYILMTLLSSILICIIRLIYRVLKIMEVRKFCNNSNTKKRMLIIGGGESSSSILREFAKSPDNEYLPICIVDDDLEKRGRKIAGIKIMGSTYEIPILCQNYNIDVILFSIASISIEDKRRILDICSKTQREVRIVPNIYSLFKANRSLLSQIRKVEVEDLLGRDTIIFDTKKYGEYIIGKKILITGGGGSIGSELCRQIAKLDPENLVILDIYENNAYDIQQELKREYGEEFNLEVEIASIRDKNKLEKLFKEKSFDVVFHAAAHKHVPLMETNPEEAVKNNIFGTLNLVELANKYKVKKFVQISTDKAVNPTNIMGATKRVCEMIIQCMNEKSNTEFVAVRFGNVLGSNGSVIPLFKEQIKVGGPVTVTHPDIIRYFMTIPEAVSLVLTAGGFAKGGEIFVLDMGEPVKIIDLADKLIRLSGYVPNKDIKIEYTGLRPGEKLYEELLLDEEGIVKTKSKKIYIGKPISVDLNRFFKDLDELKVFSEQNDKENIEKIISRIVPTFHRTNLNEKTY